MLMEWGNPYPWVMQGFPGKVRQLIWSDRLTAAQAPLLVALTGESVVVWQKEKGEEMGWRAEPLSAHQGTVQAAAFQPGSFVLASAGADGCLFLWQKPGVLAQMEGGVEQGFSCLNWEPKGQLLAAGGEAGEVLIWSKNKRGEGFGSKQKVPGDHQTEI